MAGRAQPMKDHWKEQRLFLSRIIGAAIIVLLLSGMLVWRLVHLQVVEYERFEALSEGNQVRLETLPPTRGLILDHAGRVLAENVPTWQLIAVPEQVPDIEATFAMLEQLELLDAANHDVLVDLMRSHRRFDRVTLTNLTEVQAATFAVRRYQFPGVDIREGLIRNYPFGAVAAHTVGYVGRVSEEDLARIDRADYAGTSQIGKTGVERAYEDRLHGDAGLREIVVNAQGRPSLERVPAGGLEMVPPRPGQHVVLALDIKVQQAAYEALAGLRGAAVAIDPRNGNVITLISTPAFDPNDLATGMSQSEYNELRTDPDEPFLNRALTKNYSPGSTIKPFIGLAALHNELPYVGEDHFCGGEYRLPGRTQAYREYRGNRHGETDLHSAIVRSCNVYFYGLGVALDIDRMEVFMKSFGFGVRTGIDIGGENSGLMPGRAWKRAAFRNREDQTWYPGETVSASIGQGYMEFTPLQLAHATAALAVEGLRFRPRLLIETRDAQASGVSDVLPPDELPPVAGIAAEHWQEIESAMLGVTQEERGTARTAMSGILYPVAGKTGTAQIVGVAQDERYNAEEIEERLRDNGLFIAYAPVDDPQIAIAVVVENNGGGGTMAAPVARRMLDAYFGTGEYVAQLIAL